MALMPKIVAVCVLSVHVMAAPAGDPTKLALAEETGGSLTLIQSGADRSVPVPSTMPSIRQRRPDVDVSVEIAHHLTDEESCCMRNVTEKGGVYFWNKAKNACDLDNNHIEISPLILEEEARRKKCCLMDAKFTMGKLVWSWGKKKCEEESSFYGPGHSDVSVEIAPHLTDEAICCMRNVTGKGGVNFWNKAIKACDLDNNVEISPLTLEEEARRKKCCLMDANLLTMGKFVWSWGEKKCDEESSDNVVSDVTGTNSRVPPPGKRVGLKTNSRVPPPGKRVGLKP